MPDPHPDALKTATELWREGLPEQIEDQVNTDMASETIKEAANLITRECKLNEREAAFREMVNAVKEIATGALDWYIAAELAYDTMDKVEKLVGKQK